ncbi:MAG: hypothetical protein POH28_04545 [Acidocella sp.]|nr:hypothetical protein [Acidocella sp.]
MSGLTSLAFIAAIGVNTHIPYTDGAYANIGNMLADAHYLGVSNLRDSITDGQNGAAPLASYIRLAAAGMHFTILSGVSGHLTDATLAAKLKLIDRLAHAAPGSVVAVEGVNEINNFPITFNGVPGLQGAVDMQRALYRAVHADPALPGVSVDYFTGYAAGDYGPGPSPEAVAGLADYDNQHPYPNDAQPPSRWVDPKHVLGNEPRGIGPAVYTETGYSSDPKLPGGVNQDVQAKYELDLLCDAARYGVSRVYLYELLDAYPPGSPQGYDGYGLFNPNNTPKPVATALHNLTAILAAGAMPAKPGALPPLAFTLPGSPPPYTLVLRKSANTVDILVWREPEIWDEARHVEIPAPVITETMRFAAPHARIAIFDPLISDHPIQTAQAVSQVIFAVSDHPVIVEITR